VGKGFVWLAVPSERASGEREESPTEGEEKRSGPLQQEKWVRALCSNQRGEMYQVSVVRVFFFSYFKGRRGDACCSGGGTKVKGKFRDRGLVVVDGVWVGW